ncbi:MAG: glucose-6-phosphate isomerase [Solirubrobacterales bacterium]
MNGHIRLDLGNLVIEDAISAMAEKYGARFEAFRQKLAAGETPLNLSLNERAVLPEIKAAAEEVARRCENVVLLGIGGSALGTRAVLQFLKGPYYNLTPGGRPRLFVLDNIDPVLVSHLENTIDMAKTALIYTSKSGATPETAANFVYFLERYRSAGGKPEDVIIICDKKENGINRIAADLKCRLFHIPGGLPGRFSVLSSVGFLPAEIAGIDAAALLDGADSVHRSILEQPVLKNGLFLLGAALYQQANYHRNIHVLFNYSSLLSEFGLWFMQLWAESLGKSENLNQEEVHTGTTPLACVGATDQHSLLQLFKEGPADKVFGFVYLNTVPNDPVLPSGFEHENEYTYFGGHTMKGQLDTERVATAISLIRAGHPCYEVTVRGVDGASLGALFYFYEALVAFSAELWGIDPYNQPGVEEGKNMTYAIMGRPDYREVRADYQRQIEQHRNRERIYHL